MLLQKLWIQIIISPLVNVKFKDKERMQQ